MKADDMTVEECKLYVEEFFAKANKELAKPVKNAGCINRLSDYVQGSNKIHVIPPSKLPDCVLFEEMQLLPEMSSMVEFWKKGNKLTDKLKSIPTLYTLKHNTENSHFFLDKGKWIYNRYIEVANEILNRGHHDHFIPGFKQRYWIEGNLLEFK